jgi:hypothetical protein
MSVTDVSDGTVYGLDSGIWVIRLDIASDDGFDITAMQRPRGTPFAVNAVTGA